MKSLNRHTLVVFAALFAVCGLLIAAGSASAAQAKPGVAKASKAKRGPRGPRGQQGPQGPAGPEGPAGKGGLTKIVDVTGTTAFICAGGSCTDHASSTATCPAGYEVLGGGYDTIPGVIPGAGPHTFPDSTVYTNRAVSRTTWKVSIRVNEGAPATQSAFAAFAVCGTPQ